MQLILDLTYLNEISGGDQEFIQDILRTFLEEMPKDMATMQQAIDNSDPSLIGKIAHKTKSTLHTVGLNDLKDLASKIELESKQQVNHVDIPVWAKEFIGYIEQVYPIVTAKLEE